MYRSTRILKNSDWLGRLGSLLGHLTATRDGLLLAGAPARAKRAQRIPKLIENGNPSMPENLVMTLAYASARTDPGSRDKKTHWGREESPRHVGCVSFLAQN